MITFIIPAYNSEKTISECIKSVLQQDVEKEVIIVDNGSTDNTAQIVKNFPVRYIFEPKKGPAAARNTGLKNLNSKSKYVAFVDSDVVLPNDWAKRSLEILNKYPEVAGVGGPGRSIEKNVISEVFDYLMYSGTFRDKMKFVKSLATMNVMYKIECIQNMFFNDKLQYAAAEDTDFNLRIIKKGYKLLYSEGLWVYHYNPTTITSVVRKWFNYGKYYPLPYFWNGQLKDFGLWGRIMYLPLLVFTFVLSVFFKNFIPFGIMIFALPALYLCLGIKLKINKFYKLFVFVVVHSLKQLAQIIGIWYGIITRLK
jgi:glycosyltransferase involved in cell wall biosynthesis